MEFLKPTNEAQLRHCCDIYMAQNDPEFMRVDANSCYQSLIKHWRLNGYVRVIWLKGEIVGFIMASIVPVMYSKEKHLAQEYYCTNLTGFAAAKAVIESHKGLVEVAKMKLIPVVISQGSHMDPENTFTRILERQGWTRRGFVANIRAVPDVARVPEGHHPQRLPASGVKPA